MYENALYDLTSVYSLPKWQFLLTGLYPKPANKNALFYYLKTFGIYLLSSVLLLSMVGSLIVGVENLKEYINILYYLMAHFSYLWKLSNFVFLGGKKITKIELHLAKPINYKFLKNHGMGYLTARMEIARLFAKTFRISTAAIIMFYGCVPLIQKETQLPFAGWFFVDKVKFRLPIYILQMASLFVGATTHLNLDIYAIYIISIGSALLQMLKKCLRELDYCEESRQDITQKDLESLIYLHDHILEYIALVDDLLSYGVFMQFLTAILVICFTGFQMLIVPVKSAQFILLIIFMLVVVFEVILYCYFGNEIIFESNGISEDCYTSNWYEGTQKSKKALFLIMERSKPLVFLTAGKFFNLSLTTLLLIIKSGYSYFAVLQQVANKK